MAASGRTGLAALILGLAAAAAPAGAQSGAAMEGGAVDLALVMLIDGSASISGNTLRFQLDGHEAAFRSAEVAAAIEGGPHGAIAVTLAVYAGPGEIEVVVPWRRIASAAEADSLADAIDAARVPAPDGSTALGSAILGAAALLADGPGGLPERRIDIVGNGFSNAGIDPAAARDLVVADGITVNALAIVNEFPWLEEYYAGQVIGGPGAFVRTATAGDSFADALLSKLVREIAGQPPSEGEPVGLAGAQDRLAGLDRR